MTIQETICRFSKGQMVRVLRATIIATDPDKTSGSTIVQRGDMLEILGLHDETLRVRYPIGTARPGLLAFNVRREVIEPLPLADNS